MASLHAARLAPEGEEWRPGCEYDIIGPLGDGEGRMSVVFRIRLRPPRQGEFALKMVIHYVGETAAERAGHAQSTALVRGLGAEWREPLALPPHDCLVPVLHHYHSTEPRLRDHIDDPIWAAAAADRTLFLVMPLYSSGSLRGFIAERKAEVAAAPYGLDWCWFGQLLLRMLRAAEHLIAHDLVHGDIKDDQFFLTDDGKVVLGDFGTAWKLVDEDGVPAVLGSRDELVDRRAGVGRYKAPEVRGRTRADGNPQLRRVYAKAEAFSVGVVMVDVLGVLRDGDLLDRLCSTHLAEERRFERGQPGSNPADPTYGRKQPGWIYTEADLPPLPAGCPGWLSRVLIGLLKSDHDETERRLTAAEAIRMLEVEGVAEQWEARQEAQQATVAAHQAHAVALASTKQEYHATLLRLLGRGAAILEGVPGEPEPEQNEPEPGSVAALEQELLRRQLLQQQELTQLQTDMEDVRTRLAESRAEVEARNAELLRAETELGSARARLQELEHNRRQTAEAVRHIFGLSNEQHEQQACADAQPALSSGSEPEPEPEGVGGTGPEPELQGVGETIEILDRLEAEIVGKIRFRLSSVALGHSNYLLYGAPGVGKSVLPRRIAQKCDLLCVQITGPKLLNMLDKQMAALFDSAIRSAPCVLFIDELEYIDKLCKQGNVDATRRLTKLLIEIDRVCASRAKVTIIGATNRPDILNEAIISASRFDLAYVPLPDEAQREAFFRHRLDWHEERYDSASSLLAKHTKGFCLACLAEICERAGMNAFLDEAAGGSVEFKHVEEAMKYARRSISDKDIRHYEMYCQSLGKKRSHLERENDRRLPEMGLVGSDTALDISDEEESLYD